MLKNYIKTAFRNIFRNKTQAFINIIGLSIGLASAILILSYVWYEFSYDKFHPDVRNTYRVYQRQPGNLYMNSIDFNVTQAIFIPTVKQDFPEIKYASRIWSSSKNMSTENIARGEEKFYGVDPDFLYMFAVELTMGRAKDALLNRNSIAISEGVAEKYFPEENPMGKQIKMDSVYLTVTAVFKEFPKNSHLSFDKLIPFDIVELYNNKRNLENWRSSSYKAYIQLYDGISENEMEEKLIPFIKRYVGEKTKRRYLLQAITDIHLKGKLNFELSSNGDLKNVLIFAAIGLFILLIASFNYMNLATAQSLRRAKEVGLRKVLGANRSQLIKQFLVEAFLLSFLSLLIAIILIGIFTPYFNQLIDRDLSQFYSGSLFFLLLFLLVIGMALLSGSYPAIHLSRFSPIKALKGNNGGAGKSINFRNLLVILQFVISASLIICTIVVIRQLNFIKNKDLGFETANIITFKLRGVDEVYLKNELLQHPGILDVSSSNQVPSRFGNTNTYNYHALNEKIELKLYTARVDHNFIKFYNLNLIQGEGFKPSMKDRSVAIINQEAAKKMGIKNVIGKNIEGGWKDKYNLRIIGVLKNFHFNSLYLQIQPAILIFREQHGSSLSVKLDHNKIAESLAIIEEKYNSLSPEFPFSYQFIEDSIDKTYTEEQKLAKLFNFFTVLAVFIASLGLFGLVSFIVEQRTKEIGIRKVLGSSISNVVIMLSKYFTKWVILANIIAWPIAWYFMEQWLSSFSYRIKQGFWIFLLAFGITFIIALLTAGFQSLKAAYAKPVDSLKYE